MQVVVLNHHTELDWLFAWQLADRAGLVSFKILVIFWCTPTPKQNNAWKLADMAGLVSFKILVTKPSAHTNV